MTTTRPELTQLLLERSTYKALAIRATEALWTIIRCIDSDTRPSDEVMEEAKSLYYELIETMNR